MSSQKFTNPAPAANGNESAGPRRSTRANKGIPPAWLRQDVQASSSSKHTRVTGPEQQTASGNDNGSSSVRAPAQQSTRSSFTRELTYGTRRPIRGAKLFNNPNALSAGDQPGAPGNPSIDHGLCALCGERGGLKYSRWLDWSLCDTCFGNFGIRSDWRQNRECPNAERITARVQYLRQGHGEQKEVVHDTIIVARGPVPVPMSVRAPVPPLVTATAPSPSPSPTPSPGPAPAPAVPAPVSYAPVWDVNHLRWTNTGGKEENPPPPENPAVPATINPSEMHLSNDHWVGEMASTWFNHCAASWSAPGYEGPTFGNDLDSDMAMSGEEHDPVPDPRLPETCNSMGDAHEEYDYSEFINSNLMQDEVDIDDDLSDYLDAALDMSEFSIPETHEEVDSSGLFEDILDEIMNDIWDESGSSN